MAPYVFICLVIITVCSVITSLVIVLNMEDISNYLDSIKTKMYEINGIVTDIRFYEHEKIRKKHSCYDERDLK